MPAPQFLDSWITYKAAVLYRGATPPHPGKYQLCFANVANLTRTSTKQNFIAAELLQVDGYSRQPVIWNGDGFYNPAQKRHEMPTVSLTFAASGAALQFQTVFLIADARNDASITFDGAGAVENNRLTVVGSQLSEAEEILFKLQPGATFGGEANKVYKAINVVGDSFQVSENGNSAIALNTVGTLHLCFAAGRVALLKVEPEPVTVPDGQPVEYGFLITEVNAVFGAGA